MPDSFDGFCSLWPGRIQEGGMRGVHPVVGFKFFVSRFYFKSCILSASSVSTNGTTISSNANRFAVVIKFPETVL